MVDQTIPTLYCSVFVFVGSRVARLYCVRVMHHEFCQFISQLCVRAEALLFAEGAGAEVSANQLMPTFFDVRYTVF